MSSRIFNIVWSVARWALILVSVTPLLYVGGVYYPFVVPKVIYFRTLIELVSVLVLTYALVDRTRLNLAIFKKKVIWIPLVFLAASYFSALFGIDFYHSFWSIFERMDGLVTLTHIIAYFYLILLVFKKDDWRKFFIFNGIIGSLVALYALGQSFGISWFQDLADTRVKGTIGNAAFLASYLGIIFFLALYLARDTAGRVTRASWYILSVLSVVVILLTQTRGAIVAGVLALIVYLAYLLFTAQEKKFKKYALIGIVSVIVLGGIGFSYRDKLSTSRIPFIARTASISLSDPTTMSRLFIWKNSLSAFTEHPLLGYGMENFEYVYNKFYDPQVVAEEWFDRSHNVYIDQLIHGGVLGFILYMFLVGYALYLAWCHIHKDKHVGQILFFLLVVYTAQNFFVFETLSSAFLFWTIFAFLLFLTAESDELKASSAGIHWTAWVVVAVTGGGMMFVWYFVNYLPLQANRALGEGYLYQVADVKRSLAAFDQALSYGTFADMESGYQTYDTNINRAAYANKIAHSDMVASYEAATDLYKMLIEKYPWNVRLYIYFGHVVENRPEGTTYDEAIFENFMEKATELSPKRSTAYYIWANMYLAKLKDARTATEKEKLNSKALDILSLYASRVPNFPDAQFVVSGVAEKAGKKDIAEDYFKKGELAYTPSVALARRAVGYLLRIGDYARAERYLKDIAEGDSKNPEVWLDLAKVYYLNGKVDEAVEALNTVNAIDPEVIKKDPALANQILGSYK